MNKCRLLGFSPRGRSGNKHLLWFFPFPGFTPTAGIYRTLGTENSTHDTSFCVRPRTEGRCQRQCLNQHKREPLYEIPSSFGTSSARIAISWWVSPT